MFIIQRFRSFVKHFRFLTKYISAFCELCQKYNKSENLYFALLGDCSEENVKVKDEDYE